jgi:hypothetical protein
VNEATDGGLIDKAARNDKETMAFRSHDMASGKRPAAQSTD